MSDFDPGIDEQAPSAPDWGGSDWDGPAWEGPDWDGPDSADPDWARRPWDGSAPGSRWPDRTGAGTFVPVPWAPPEPAARPRRRVLRVLAAVAAVTLVAAAGVLGWLAYGNDRSATKWRQLEQAQAARATALSTQLRLANQRIVTLDSQVGTLNTETGNLQSQLSSVADQKEKAVDQATALHQLLSAAGTVADDLQQCITATNQFSTDLNSTVASGQTSGFGALQHESAQVDQICNRAEDANQQLQAAISSAP